VANNLKNKVFVLWFHFTSSQSMLLFDLKYRLVEFKHILDKKRSFSLLFNLYSPENCTKIILIFRSSSRK